MENPLALFYLRIKQSFHHLALQKGILYLLGSQTFRQTSEIAMLGSVGADLLVGFLL